MMLSPPLPAKTAKLLDELMRHASKQDFETMAMLTIVGSALTAFLMRKSVDEFEAWLRNTEEDE